MHDGLCIQCNNAKYAEHLGDLDLNESSYLIGYDHGHQGMPPASLSPWPDDEYDMGYADGQGDARVALHLKQQCGPDGRKYWMPLEGQYFEVLWEAIAAKRMGEDSGP